MGDTFALVTGLHWAGVLFYVAATIATAFATMFKRERAERLAYYLIIPGLLLHGIGIIIWWRFVGHGPYMDRFEVLSSNAWVLLVAFLLGVRFYPRLKLLSIAVFPTAFLLVAIGLFLQPEIKRLPPTFRSIWLVLHITFYKIALAAIIIAFAFSLFYVLRSHNRLQWATKIPDLQTMDLYAYRFAGFGFTFWAIAMLAGSIWAYQSWNEFWSWDPVQTWSLVTWIAFGIYLHLRRFFGWSGERAAWIFGICFLLSLFSLFFTPFIKSSIHADYFK